MPRASGLASSHHSVAVNVPHVAPGAHTYVSDAHKHLSDA